MKVNRDNVSKGRFGILTPKMVETLHRRVSQYKRGDRNFKIGITNDPDRRAREYYYRDGNRYHEMVVLYQTRRLGQVRKLEAVLVRKHRADSDNEQGGGGGSAGKPPYYLYVVRSLAPNEMVAERTRQPSRGVRGWVSKMIRRMKNKQ